MCNSSLAVGTVDYNEEVGGTEVVYLLVDSSVSDKPNTAVTHVDFSCVNPDAVYRVTVGRVESTDSVGATPGHYLRGNIPTRTVPGLGHPGGLTIDNFHHVLGRYYVSGGQPFQLKFAEPVESLRDAESSTDQVFAVAVKRMDASESQKVGLNVWYGSY